MNTINLGYAPATGADSRAQCNMFKIFTYNAIKRPPEDCFLATLDDNASRQGMVVNFNAEYPPALQWAHKARDLAEGIWHQIETGVYPQHRVLKTSKGAER